MCSFRAGVLPVSRVSDARRQSCPTAGATISPMPIRNRVGGQVKEKTRMSVFLNGKWRSGMRQAVLPSLQPASRSSVP